MKYTPDDVKLIKLAGVAANLNLRWWNNKAYSDPEMESIWEPLHDDGDAFRLAMTLEIAISSSVLGKASVQCKQLDNFTSYQLTCTHNQNHYSQAVSCRRLIVLVAAEIGKLKVPVTN